MLEQKLGRDKENYPLTAKWYDPQSKKYKFVDYRHINILNVDINSLNAREKESISSTIATNTIRKYMIKDTIELLDGTKLMIMRIEYTPRERKSKVLSKYLNNKYNEITLYLGNQ